MKLTHISNLDISRDLDLEQRNERLGLPNNTAVIHMHQHNYQDIRLLASSIKNCLVPLTPQKPQLRHNLHQLLVPPPSCLLQAIQGLPQSQHLCLVIDFL